MAIWKIAPGRNAGEWEWMRDYGCIAISWLNSLDLSDFTKDEFTDALAKADEGAWNSANSIDAFVHEVMKGDVVVANNGLSEVVGIGTVTSGYLPPDHRRNPNREDDYFRHAYLVDWLVKDSVRFPRALFNQPTVQRLTDDQVSRIRDRYWKEYPKLRPLIKQLLGGFDRDADSWVTASDGDDRDDAAYKRSQNAERRLVIRQIKERRGQQRFRNLIRKRYGDRCMVTGCDVLHVLEAAHIDAHVDESMHHSHNGLLLRADVHTLFDLNLIGIEPETLKIDLHPSILQGNEYRKLIGARLKCPDGKRPAVEALRRRYKTFKKFESRTP